MALKALKVIWVFSLAGVLASFLYVYASLPEKVIVNENPQTIALSKEALFYMVLALIAIANVLVFVVTRIYSRNQDDFKAWFYGLTACANLFFVVGLSFISLYNSGEKYDFARLGTIIYGSVGLLLAWAIAWPVYSIAKKILAKQPV